MDKPSDAEVKRNRGTRAAPSEAVLLERARSFANEALWTVKLQRRRLQRAEPEDDKFVMRRWADWQFFILALSRLQYAAQLAGKVQPVSADMRAAIKSFTEALPGLRTMRNVGEHVDDYAVDRGRADVGRGELQLGAFSEDDFEWLGYKVNADFALEAAERLFVAVREASRRKVEGSPDGYGV
jgi:hypothetical protein